MRRTIDPTTCPTLLDWWRDETNHPADAMRWKDAVWPQIKFLRDELPQAFFRNYQEYQTSPARVISTHTSKSIRLPVVHFLTPYGVEYVLRDNFYFWNVSVWSACPVPPLPASLCPPDEIRYCFFEGFPDEWKFGPYDEDPRQFSFYTDSSPYPLWTACFLIREALGRISAPREELR